MIHKSTNTKQFKLKPKDMPLGSSDLLRMQNEFIQLDCLKKTQKFCQTERCEQQKPAWVINMEKGV